MGSTIARRRLAAAGPRSCVHPDKRTTTCTTSDCHPGASPNLASFDVHSTRDRSTHALEFSIALFFVLLTLAVLLPMLTFNILGPIREVFASHETEKAPRH